MKLEIEHHLDELFDDRHVESKGTHIDLLEIKTAGLCARVYIIAKTTFQDKIFSQREYFAFDSENEAFAWLDENGFNLLA